MTRNIPSSHPWIENPHMNISIKVVEEEYERCRSHWRDSSGWKDIDWIHELKQSFQMALHESASRPVTQIICMGIKSFTAFPYEKNPVWKSSPYHQLIALEFYLDILNLQQGFTIGAKDVCFRNPFLGQTDKQFLLSKGIAALEDTEAYNRMTSTTFIYAPHCPWSVTCHALMVAYPALYMGTSCCDSRHSLTSASLSQPRFRYFHENWSAAEMPSCIKTSDGELITLGDMLYWKAKEGKVITTASCINHIRRRFPVDVFANPEDLLFIGGEK